MLNRPIACIDVETTGTSPQHDRITEIGVVEIDPDGSVREWSTLLNPETRIPPFIEKLTGISNAMVADAPHFVEIADELQQRLAGRIFVAHNVRFDHAFIKNEFKRIERDFRTDTLCTVRLSRRLYPQYFKHNLDSLIQRLGLTMDDRHRALADARVLAAFLRRLPQELEAETINAAIRHVMAKPALPTHLPENLIDDIPDGPGVYLLFGDNDMPLYIGKSTRLRMRVLSHFSDDHRNTKELRIAQQTKRVEWRETAGELGALLLEARLVKEMQPLHNQRLRREEDLCAWQLVATPADGHRLTLRHASEDDFARGEPLYGMYTSERKAIQTLRELATAHRLCLVQLGLEKPARGKSAPCFAHQLQRCHGVCIGKEDPRQHDSRLMTALSRLRLQSWPYAGPVAIHEQYGSLQEWHVIDDWRHLGTTQEESELAAILESSRQNMFDPDTYKILAKRINACTVMPLGNPPPNIEPA